MFHCSTSHRLLRTKLSQTQLWLHICHLWKSKKRKYNSGGKKKKERSHWGDANAAVKPRRAASTEVQESFELTGATATVPQGLPTLSKHPRCYTNLSAAMTQAAVWEQGSSGRSMATSPCHRRMGTEWAWRASMGRQERKILHPARKQGKPL